MKRSFSFFGIISLVVVVIILIMTCFAVLTYLNSRNDLNLTRMAADTLSDYYKAEKNAYEKLEKLSGLIEEGDKELSENGYTAVYKEGGLYIRFTADINDTREISCEVLVIDQRICEITSWKTVLK
ncbi:MAG: hypothetical protein GX061_08490 [Eubacteriaceae bacterium]|nr:hypothetical protein [Eubacteriaceae bacterium]